MDEQNKIIPNLQRWKSSYVVIIVLFLVWMAFGDKNNFVHQYRLHRKIGNLEKQKNFYIEKIRKDRMASEEIFGSRENLEKFAREKYMMKKKDEDIYIITTK